MLDKFDKFHMNRFLQIIKQNSTCTIKLYGQNFPINPIIEEQTTQFFPTDICKTNGRLPSSGAPGRALIPGHQGDHRLFPLR